VTESNVVKFLEYKKLIESKKTNPPKTWVESYYSGDTVPMPDFLYPEKWPSQIDNYIESRSVAKNSAKENPFWKPIGCPDFD